MLTMVVATEYIRSIDCVELRFHAAAIQCCKNNAAASLARSVLPRWHI